MYEPVFTKPFNKDVKSITRDKVLYDRLWKKIEEILNNPEHYPAKKYEFKGKKVLMLAHL